MAAISDDLENKLINHIFRNTDYVRVDPIYVALFTTATTDAGGGTEVTGGSYARTLIQTGVDSGWDAASGGATANTGAITFPTATADWGTVTHVAIVDTASGAFLSLWHGALTSSKVVNNGDIFRFNAGELDVTIA